MGDAGDCYPVASPIPTTRSASSDEVVVSPAVEVDCGAFFSTLLVALGYEEPTPIQRETIHHLLAGKDLLGQAATGTGKTAAFALPLIQQLTDDPDRRRDKQRVRGLILVPTRELAMQVAQAIHKY